MSALDFGAGIATNATRFFGSTGLAPIAAAGAAAGCWVRHGTFTPNSVLMGFGVSGAASSFQLRTFSSQYGAQARDASGGNVSAGANFPADGDVLLIAQFTGASLDVYIIPEGSTPVGSSDSSGAAFATITPGAGWYIGSDGSDFAKTPLGECFLINRVLTLPEMTILAAGNPITAVEPAPLLYYPLRNGAVATEPNLGSASGSTMSINGTGFTTTTDFWLPANDGTYQLTSDLYF